MFAGDLLKERARITPDRLALVSVEAGVRLTYAELDARADAAAATLSSRLQPGDRFGILAWNCVEFLELFFGAGRAGVIAVPLSTRATPHELAGIAADCGMKALFHGEDFADVAAGLDVERHPVGFRDTSQAVSNEAVDPEAPYCLLYTSGTTGRPKGVIISRRQLYWNGYNTALNWALREDDVTQIFTPLYHAGGLAVFLIPLFSTGGAVVLHRGFDPAEIWRTLRAERSTVILGVPTIWKMLMESDGFATADFSSVRWLISGGAPLPQPVIAGYQQRGVVFKQGYGMTEVGVNCFTMTVEESFRKRGSIGKPMMFTAVRLVKQDGAEAEIGEVGEMWIRGPHVSSGYWNNEEATRAAYDTQGWFHTGDLARRDEDGCFTIAGRLREMFISGGVNVYPAEIEVELMTHPAVADAAVVAVPDAKWGEIGVAFVVAAGTDDQELVRHLESRIAKYKIPRRFVFVDALPRTPYGKVVKAELLHRVQSEEA